MNNAIFYALALFLAVLPPNPVLAQDAQDVNREFFQHRGELVEKKQGFFEQTTLGSNIAEGQAKANKVGAETAHSNRTQGSFAVQTETNTAKKAGDVAPQEQVAPGPKDKDEESKLTEAYSGLEDGHKLEAGSIDPQMAEVLNTTRLLSQKMEQARQRTGPLDLTTDSINRATQAVVEVVDKHTAVKSAPVKRDRDDLSRF